ncbi:hypothetical protein B0A55_09027 [Friedmanniomyces simplex]|uniref:nitric oxide dioxygenase n=1 Tax=Friedmanniomyces simplex TaxID=329884 RepID=A0A4V6WKW6_9PEZI|nr:hypothetical protein B0A55_09027 [Friedmanniomyces simplex]
MALTMTQIDIIRSTAPILKDHGEAITRRFYADLLTENPSLNEVFNQANQKSNHQAAALAGALYAYATNINDLGALTPAVTKICHKHASLNIQPEQYEVVGEYLLKAMGNVLGAALTPKILEAWTVAYWQLANLMIGQEAQLLATTGQWKDGRDFKIVAKSQESSEITSFYLAPVDERPLPSFLPGQYISVTVFVPELGYHQARQYSLSDAPKAEHYRISVKRQTGDADGHPGFVSNVLHDLEQVGDTISVSHPFGEFFLDFTKDKGKPIVLIAAGVGITPMISILNASVLAGYQPRISIIQTARSGSVRAFANHCADLASKHANVSFKSLVKDADPCGCHDVRGRLSLSALDPKDDLLLDDTSTLYFVCGPEGFMADIHRDLCGMGVGSARIRMEIFGTGASPSA